MANGLLSLYCPGRTNLHPSTLRQSISTYPGARMWVCAERKKKNTGRNVKNSQVRKAISLPEEPRRRRRCCPDRDFKPFGRCRGEGFFRSLSTWRESFVSLPSEITSDGNARSLDGNPLAWWFCFVGLEEIRDLCMFLWIIGFGSAEMSNKA